MPKTINIHYSNAFSHPLCHQNLPNSSLNVDNSFNGQDSIVHRVSARRYAQRAAAVAKKGTTDSREKCQSK